eukprot:5491950-Prymnesium_polylepis.1
MPQPSGRYLKAAQQDDGGEHRASGTYVLRLGQVVLAVCCLLALGYGALAVKQYVQLAASHAAMTNVAQAVAAASGAPPSTSSSGPASASDEGAGRGW